MRRTSGREAVGRHARRLDRMLKVETKVDHVDEELHHRLRLAIVARRAIWHDQAVSEYKSWTGGQSWPFAGRDRCGMLRIEPRLIPGRRHGKAQVRNDRRGRSVARGSRKGIAI